MNMGRSTSLSYPVVTSNCPSRRQQYRDDDEYYYPQLRRSQRSPYYDDDYDYPGRRVVTLILILLLMRIMMNVVVEEEPSRREERGAEPHEPGALLLSSGHRVDVYRILTLVVEPMLVSHFFSFIFGVTRRIEQCDGVYEDRRLIDLPCRCSDTYDLMNVRGKKVSEHHRSPTSHHLQGSSYSYTFPGASSHRTMINQPCREFR
ncbi:hypothetical protein EDD15DRAFT_793499 [Pisolithus albus]|nr:hypothetical protein EDD15DRAFT_793499 [Pisolithus albus]